MRRQVIIWMGIFVAAAVALVSWRLYAPSSKVVGQSHEFVAQPSTSPAVVALPLAPTPSSSMQTTLAAESLEAQIQAVLALPKSGGRRQALEDLGGALALFDPENAARVLRQLLAEGGEAGGEAYGFVSGFMSDYAQKNPAAAAVWAEPLPDYLKYSAFGFVAVEWAKSDLAGAARWAGNIDDVGLRGSVLRRISQEIEGHGDVSSGMVWARFLADSPEATEHAATISRLWARGDARGAFAWAVQLPQEAERVASVVAIASITVETDPEATRNWLTQFSAGGLRDEAVAAAARTLAQRDPAAAVRWLPMIDNAGIREASVRSIGALWMQKDAPRATLWIKAAPISDTTKAYLIGDRRP